MRYRAQNGNISYNAPYIPPSLTSVIGRLDPASQKYSANDTSNPFFGKKILVLSGKEDKLVPWVASDKFVDKLQVGESGIKEVVVAEGVGHECTKTMVELAGRFVEGGMLM